MVAKNVNFTPKRLHNHYIDPNIILGSKQVGLYLKIRLTPRSNLALDNCTNGEGNGEGNAQTGHIDFFLLFLFCRCENSRGSDRGSNPQHAGKKSPCSTTSAYYILFLNYSILFYSMQRNPMCYYTKLKSSYLR